MRRGEKAWIISDLRFARNSGSDRANASASSEAEEPSGWTLARFLIFVTLRDCGRVGLRISVLIPRKKGGFGVGGDVGSCALGPQR